MSHLREQISALIDGELTGAELDRANAHLAACGRCRAEAIALRQLKRELHALAGEPFDTIDGQQRDAAAGGIPGIPGVPGEPGAPGQGSVQADEALTRRLLAMAGPGGPVPSRRFRREQFHRDRREQQGGRPASGRGGRGGTRPGRHPSADSQRNAGRPPREPRRRGRYVVWSAVSLVVVGIGAAAFNMGGAGAEPGPKITPQLEMQMFGLEHAITSGDVPFPDPSQAPTARP